ncbi:hypothetical protein ACGFMM_19130 [Streptomyces sp. NPDC048604]|uniref:hypothetical protein n=1 Tax=Streptomyces sp. NPDC048604 TaxID=3365578 RepID=UPI0037127032
MADGTDRAGGAVAGTPARARDSVILRLSRDLAEAMGGTLEPVATAPGFAMLLTLPAAAPRTP